MASVPEMGGPITEGQQPPLNSATADGARHDGAWSRWWRSKRIWKPFILSVIGVGFLLGGFWMYSSPGELSTPSFATIQLKSAFPIGSILYDVSQTSPSIAKITVFVDLPGNVLHTPTKAPAVDLWLEVPYGIGFETCPKACRRDPNEQEYTWLQTLDFKYEDSDANSGEALAIFSVEAHNFGYVFNDVNAAAAIPRVVLVGQGAATPILYTEYNVTSANSYDWSSLQPQLTNASEVRWDEPVTSGATPGTVAVGMDQANEAQDNFETFIAGAFIGVAAGALLAAAQEWLHRNDDADTAKAVIGALRSASVTDGHKAGS